MSQAVRLQKNYRRHFGLFALVASGLLAAPGVASAAVYTAAGGSIPDNAPTAGLVITFNVTQTAPITNIGIQLTNLTHTFAGDLIITLAAPDGTTVDILRRPGSTLLSVGGDSSNFGATYQFVDGGADPVAALAASSDSNFVLPAGIYEATTTGVVTTAGTPTSLNAAFDGLVPTGTWTLTITDNAGLDTGTVGVVALATNGSVPAVPEPATFSLFGIGALTLLQRRRA